MIEVTVEDFYISRNITLKLTASIAQMLDELAQYLGVDRSSVIRLMMLFALENFYAWLAYAKRKKAHPHTLNVWIHDELSRYRHVYL